MDPIILVQSPADFLLPTKAGYLLPCDAATWVKHPKALAFTRDAIISCHLQGLHVEWAVLSQDESGEVSVKLHIEGIIPLNGFKGFINGLPPANIDISGLTLVDPVVIRLSAVKS